jgi:hypothetical protein
MILLQLRIIGSFLFTIFLQEVCMFKKVLLSAVVLAAAVSMTGCAGGAGGLPTFGSDFGKKSTPMGDLRIPYTDLLSYYGYVTPGAKPDAVENGKNMFYIYVWVPIVAPEIGVRMCSPAAGEPKAGDFVSPDYTANAKDKTNYFDTWINFERSADILNPQDIKAKIASTSWLLYDSNDDSSEMPKQPSGSKYNSLLRITSSPSDPLKALVRGLYRVGFTTYKTGDVKGSFLAQVGAPIKIPGVVIAKDIDGLVAAIEKNASK